MGKRSGVPHRDEELERLTVSKVEAELAKARQRLAIAPSTKMAKLAQKSIHWLEAELGRRD